jgi:transcriptional regulator with XRE-family HTH domain
MSEQCPSCGLTQPFVPSYPSVIHCGCCGQSLIAGAPDGFCLGEFEVSEFSVWCGSALSDLVSRRLVLGKEGALAHLRSNIDHICGMLTDGNRKQLCRSVGLQPCALKGWMTGERPSLAVLLRLCFGIRVMPSDMFLSQQIEVEKARDVRMAATSQRSERPQLGFRERDRIKSLLNVIIADTGDARRLVDVAAQIGLSRSALKYWFRQECREMVFKRRSAEDRRMVLKYRKNHDVLRSVVQNLRAQKINLSRWQVEAELRKHQVTLIRPDLFKALEWMRIS